MRPKTKNKNKSLIFGWSSELIYSVTWPDTKPIKKEKKNPHHWGKFAYTTIGWFIKSFFSLYLNVLCK